MKNVLNTAKDVINFLQKSNDIEMVNKVIDIQQKILEMQEEIQMLKDENRKLKDQEKLKRSIVRHERDNVVTLKNNDKIYYCSKCLDDEGKLIQVNLSSGSLYTCPKCKNHNYFFGKEQIGEAGGASII